MPGVLQKVAEIFQNYELHKLPWWRRVWRIAAGSVVLHIILVALVLYVPALREALNIAGAFSDAKYVDKDYDKTIIGERAVLINTTDVFEYPPGYFYDPAAVDPNAPQIIATATPIPLPTPLPPPRVRTPKVKPTPAEALASASPSPSPQATPEDLTAGLPENMTPEEREKKLNEIAAKKGIERPDEKQINSKPLKDWLAHAKEKRDKKEIDLTGQIEMVIEADRMPDGKLANAVATPIKGDPKLQELVKEFVAALSDSQALASLKDIKHIRLTVLLTETEVTVKATSDVESPARASEMASGFNALLFVGKISKKGQMEEIIYKNTKVSSDGKQVILNFTMPRKDVTDILTKLSSS